MASQNLLVGLRPNELNVSMIGLKKKKNHPVSNSHPLIRMDDAGGPSATMKSKKQQNGAGGAVAASAVTHLVREDFLHIS